MTLFEKIEQLISLGYNISFSREINNLSIVVSKIDNKDEITEQESHLPLSNHFYEDKIVDCIDFQINKIHEQLKPNHP
jgi:hypothetical protein